MHKFTRILKKLHLGQKGMTGLETAIILIAFVTVASVLAYSVLSAGIFSAERGKETVYAGLQQAQSTLEVKGTVIGSSDDDTTLTSMIVKLGLVIPDETVDKDAVYVSFYDDTDTEHLTLDTDFTLAMSTGSTERGAANIIEGDEVWIMTVTIPAGASVESYEWCAIQISPPTGASLNIKRTMPGDLASDYFLLQ
jgi:flagellin FlaB